MFKLLVNNPVTSVQEILVVDSGGSFFDPGSVLWDERVDGRLSPELLASVGGLVRNGNVLSVDAELLAAHQAAQSAAQAAASAKANRIAQAKQVLNGLDFGAPLSAAQLTNGLKSVVVIMKDLSSQLG